MTCCGATQELAKYFMKVFRSQGYWPKFSSLWRLSLSQENTFAEMCMKGYSRMLVPFFSNEAHYYLCSAHSLCLSDSVPLCLSLSNTLYTHILANYNFLNTHEGLTLFILVYFY